MTNPKQEIYDYKDDLLAIADKLEREALAASVSQRRRLTLKEQALTALHAVATGANDTHEQHQDLETILRALEALPK